MLVAPGHSVDLRVFRGSLGAPFSEMGGETLNMNEVGIVVLKHPGEVTQQAASLSQKPQSLRQISFLSAMSGCSPSEQGMDPSSGHLVHKCLVCLSAWAKGRQGDRKNCHLP